LLVWPVPRGVSVIPRAVSLRVSLSQSTGILGIPLPALLSYLFSGFHHNPIVNRRKCARQCGWWRQRPNEGLQAGQEQPARGPEPHDHPLFNPVALCVLNSALLTMTRLQHAMRTAKRSPGIVSTRMVDSGCIQAVWTRVIGCHQSWLRAVYLCREGRCRLAPGLGLGAFEMGSGWQCGTTIGDGMVP